MKTHKHPIAVLGAGSWGTALALVLSRNGVETRLWSVEPDHVAEMQKEKVNRRFLPDHPFPATLTVYDDLEACLKGIRDILIVVPSFAFREVMMTLKPKLQKDTRLVWATKGLDANHQLLHEVVQEIVGRPIPIAVLSGPSLAKEVADGLPAAVALASNDPAFSKDLIDYFHAPHFRVYQNNDMVGIELCGTIKNVLAIATGICDGLQFGSNARSALITRGLAEMIRLCEAMGAKRETVIGLAGLGDLVLTCTDDKSRNRRFGLALGRGKDRQTAEKEIGQAVEGLYNVDQVNALAKIHNIDMPITHQVYRIIHENLNAKKAVQELLDRTPKME